MCDYWHGLFTRHKYSSSRALGSLDIWVFRIGRNEVVSGSNWSTWSCLWVWGLWIKSKSKIFLFLKPKQEIYKLFYEKRATLSPKPRFFSKKRSPGSTNFTVQVQQTSSNNIKTTPPLSPWRSPPIPPAPRARLVNAPPHPQSFPSLPVACSLTSVTCQISLPSEVCSLFSLCYSSPGSIDIILVYSLDNNFVAACCSCSSTLLQLVAVAVFLRRLACWSFGLLVIFCVVWLVGCSPVLHKEGIAACWW